MAKSKKKTGKKKATGRGGARPGSGPKRKMKDACRITVWLSDDHLSILYAYGKEHGLTRSESVRQLIGAAS